MAVRYYEREHFDAYARIKEEGLHQWSDLHEELAGFEDFPNRPFLERMLPAVAPGQRSRVLEYGCGTGPAACFLAERGYDVHGIDLVPDAIEIARRHASERELNIRFEVADICQWEGDANLYDVVLDSFCLQSIVLDNDREAVLKGVHRRLKPDGRYLLSTAVFERARDYGDAYYDAATGIVWMSTAGPGSDARWISGAWYLPHRRHLTASALRGELERYGYRIIEQSPAGGDVVASVQ
jgi:2-polyprenyl-3-methyl-5-hydroxy-6-metoxy-1,4-benzoquinol methylase